MDVLNLLAGYRQEWMETGAWAHEKEKLLAPATQPSALSIIQGRAVGVTNQFITFWAELPQHGHSS